MDSLFSAGIDFCQIMEHGSLGRKRLLNCLHLLLRIDLSFSFYCSGSKMFKKK